MRFAALNAPYCKFLDMWYYIFVNCFGKVDAVPGVCYVITEFVCVFGYPILPRRSLLVYRNELAVDGKAVAPIGLSWKSVFMGYAKVICFVWTVFGVVVLLILIPHHPPQTGGAVGLAGVLCVGTPCLLLFLLHKLSFASQSRMDQLAETKGLPEIIVADLRHGGHADGTRREQAAAFQSKVANKSRPSALPNDQITTQPPKLQG